MFAQPQKEHQWLEQLIGEWTFESECMGPDQQPMKHSGVDRVRSLGGLWFLCEGEAEVPGGGAATNIMTLGYDPAKKKFVSVWVDNMGMALEPAEGTLSADKKTLTMTFGATNPKTGKRMAIVETLTRKDDKTVLFEMNEVTPDEKTNKMLEITYTKM